MDSGMHAKSHQWTSTDSDTDCFLLRQIYQGLYAKAHLIVAPDGKTSVLMTIASDTKIAASLAIHEPENRAILGSISPGNSGVACDGWFVYLFQHPMPPKPWPLTIAGLPSYITPGLGPQHTPRPGLRPVPLTNEVIHQDHYGHGMKD